MINPLIALFAKASPLFLMAFFYNGYKKTRQWRVVNAGALRMQNRKRVAGIYPRRALFLRLVSCEDSDLSLTGSEPNFAKIFSHYQYRHNNGNTDDDQVD